MSDNNNNFWANPEPWGLLALAGISFILFGMYTGRIPEEETIFLFPIGVAGAAAQTMTGIILLRRGDMIPGNLFAVFGNLFMITPTLTILLEHLMEIHVATAVGYWTVFLGFTLWLWAIPMLRTPWVTWLVAPFAGLAFVVRGISVLYNIPLLTTLSGWIFLFFFGWALYNALHHLGKEADIHIPVGEPVLKRK